MPKIPDYRFEIPEAALGLCLFAANPENEYDHSAPVKQGLDHICIEIERGKKGQGPFIHAVATNGYHLAHLRWIPDLDKDIVPEGTILISKVQAKEFLKGRRPKDTRYWVQQEGDDWLVIADNGSKMVLNGTPSEYPPWQHIIPPRPSPKPEENQKSPEELALNWNLIDVFRQFSKKYLGQHGFRIVLPQTERHAVLMVPISIGYAYGGRDKPLKMEVEYLLHDGVTELEYVLMPIAG